MRRPLRALVALASTALLTSCALLPGGPPGRTSNDHQQADARMEEIADAINDHDAAALKRMFSPYALEQAVDIDDRLEDLLSPFAGGGITWERSAVGAKGLIDEGKETELLLAYYTVTADGNDYTLFFADFTVNEAVNPRNTGVYAMGVIPSTGKPPFGPESLFSAWAGAMSVDGKDERWRLAYPGVYVPVYDSADVSNYIMTRIVEEIETEDDVGLAEWFAEQARTELASDLVDRIDDLFALLHIGEVTWERLEDAPLARKSIEGAGEAVLLLPTYRVSVGSESYWLSFAVFTLSDGDPARIGINAIGVAPRTESGDSPQEQALFAWRDSFQVETGPAPGIFIAE